MMDKKTPKGNNRKRTKAGREAALKMVLDSVTPRTHTEMTDILIQDFNCSASTAKNWIAWAHKEGVQEQAGIDLTDLDNARWILIRQYQQKMAHFSKRAEEALVDPDLTRPQQYHHHNLLQKLVLDHRILEFKALHVDKIPPERDLGNPEILISVINALMRNLHKAPRYIKAQLKNALIEDLLDKANPDTPAMAQAHEEHGEVLSLEEKEIDSVL